MTGNRPISQGATVGAPVEDIPRWDGQRGDGGAAGGVDPRCEYGEQTSHSEGMVRDVFATGLIKQMPIFEGKMFQRYKQKAILYARRCGF